MHGTSLSNDCFVLLLMLNFSNSRCISSQMNSLTGRGLGSNSTNVFQGSEDRVRSARTKKIELGRSSKLHF